MYGPDGRARLVPLRPELPEADSGAPLPVGERVMPTRAPLSASVRRVRALLPDQLDRARALADAGLAELPDSPGLMDVQALVAAAERQPGRARDWLAKAIEREPLLREEARGDELLAGLVDDLAS
jgi:hypothetical protein